MVLTLVNSRFQNLLKFFSDGLVTQINRCNWQVIAYCWILNSIHAVVRTSQPNLAHGMQHWLSDDANCQYMGFRIAAAGRDVAASPTFAVATQPLPLKGNPKERFASCPNRPTARILREKTEAQRLLLHLFTIMIDRERKRFSYFANE